MIHHICLPRRQGCLTLPWHAGHCTQLAQHARQAGCLHANQGGVVVSELEQGCSCSVGETLEQQLHVRNEGGAEVVLHSFNLLRRNAAVT